MRRSIVAVLSIDLEWRFDNGYVSERILTVLRYYSISHKPLPNAVEAFNKVLPTIKAEIIKSRHHWDKHEPKMWSRAVDISDHDLNEFTIEKDLILVCSAPTAYGTVILGKIRLPAVNDEEGEGYIHVRIHDPPNRGKDDITFHSLFTEELRPVIGEPPISWRSIHTKDKPLEFFNE